jgi:hypothetical protein
LVLAERNVQIYVPEEPEGAALLLVQDGSDFVNLHRHALSIQSVTTGASDVFHVTVDRGRQEAAIFADSQSDPRETD